jgi:putative CRISPR-associated protein (TIGR02620 family)
MAARVYIVTRHKGAIEWMMKEFGAGVAVDGIVVGQWTGNEPLSPGDRVIGVLPLPMVADILDKGARFLLICLPDIAFGQRGQELTPKEMTAAGAYLQEIEMVKLGNGLYPQWGELS